MQRIELPALRPLEALTLALRRLYEQYGYAPYSMTHMEEYAFYMENRNFLDQPEIAVFSDLDGRLMALKPDVTLSIARSIPPGGAELRRLYYAENVFRPSAQAGGFRELSQMGLECIGPVTEYAAAEVAFLAERSLAATGRDYALELSHLDLLGALLEELAPPPGALAALRACVKQKNAHDLAQLAGEAGLSAAGTERLLALVSAPVGDEVEQERREEAYRQRVIDSFFEYGRLTAIPRQRKKKRIVLEVAAENFEPGRLYVEREVNDVLSAINDDVCTLRRDLVGEGLLARDARGYWRPVPGPDEPLS